MYSVLSVIRLIQSMFTREMGYSARMREMRNAYTISFKKRKLQTPLGKFRHTQEDNITA